MLHLLELQELYATMSPFARRRLLDTARELRKNFPAPKKNATLTVVQNNAQAQGASGEINRDLNRFSVVLVG